MPTTTDTPASLPRRYYRPHEAAQELGVTTEAIRQAVLRFDGDGARVPLYFELKQAVRTVWAPYEYMQRAHDTGIPNKGQVRNSHVPGEASWWDVTEGEPGTLMSREITLGPGLWLELDPMHCHELAAEPDKVQPLHWFQSPSYQLGAIPPVSLLQLFDPKPKGQFADCWIAAEDVEAIRSGTPRKLDLSAIHNFPEELRCAIEAHIAVRTDTEATRKHTPRQAILKWLETERPGLQNKTRERVATVANWKKGGPAETPGG